MTEMVVNVGGREIYRKQVVETKVPVKSIHKGELEEVRKTKIVPLITRAVVLAVGGVRIAKRAFADTSHAGMLVAASGGGGEQIRRGFTEIIDVFTAIAEPILWFYALIGCVMMATGKNKDAGWNRIKQVGYAYIGIALLPAFFAFLRWIANMLKGAIQF
jgi:hypothetical protein